MSKKTLEAKVSIWTKLFNFFKTKTEVAIINNISTEEHYQTAALKVIEEIEKLRKRSVEADSDIKRLNNLAGEKDKARESKDKEILALRKTSPNTDVSTHVKLALLYKHTAEQFRVKATNLEAMQLQIAQSVVELSDTKDDLAVRLELIRETAKARADGIADVDGVLEATQLTQIDVDTILNKIQVFKGDDTQKVINSVEMDDYLAQLEGSK